MVFSCTFSGSSPKNSIRRDNYPQADAAVVIADRVKDPFCNDSQQRFRIKPGFQKHTRIKLQRRVHVCTAVTEQQAVTPKDLSPDSFQPAVHLFLPGTMAQELRRRFLPCGNRYLRAIRINDCHRFFALKKCRHNRKRQLCFRCRGRFPFLRPVQKSIYLPVNGFMQLPADLLCVFLHFFVHCHLLSFLPKFPFAFFNFYIIFPKVLSLRGRTYTPICIPSRCSGSGFMRAWNSSSVSIMKSSGQKQT